MFFVFQPLNLCDIEGLSSIVVSKEDEVNMRVDIQVKDPSKEVGTFVFNRLPYFLSAGWLVLKTRYRPMPMWKRT